jgi:hypothetical protein
VPGSAEVWIWSTDPGKVDRKWASYFEEWFDAAVKDADGFYSEALPVHTIGRLSPDKRVDGRMSMLPSFFHQIRVREQPESRVLTRGPTLEEFKGLLSRLQELLPTFRVHRPGGSPATLDSISSASVA